MIFNQRLVIRFDTPIKMSFVFWHDIKMINIQAYCRGGEGREIWSCFIAVNVIIGVAMANVPILRTTSTDLYIHIDVFIPRCRNSDVSCSYKVDISAPYNVHSTFTHGILIKFTHESSKYRREAVSWNFLVVNRCCLVEPREGSYRMDFVRVGIGGLKMKLLWEGAGFLTTLFSWTHPLWSFLGSHARIKASLKI